MFSRLIAISENTNADFESHMHVIHAWEGCTNCMEELLERAAGIRSEAIRTTSIKKRQVMAQHLTPLETAKLAASFFSPVADGEAIKCLDLGAGTGILALATYERYKENLRKIDAVEADPALAKICDEELSSAGIPHTLIIGDALTITPLKRYGRIILNPPYKKMAADDGRQASLPCHCANLYAAFIAVGIERLADNGELVAIVPRSWMNGDYFLPFRNFMLKCASLDLIHVYGSRKEVFSDTDVLQETVIVRLSKKPQAEKIVISSSDTKHSKVMQRSFPFYELINAETKIVRIAPEESSGLNETLKDLGLCASTGKVVDFRSRDRTYLERPNDQNIFPLVYAGNFSTGVLSHPLNFGKPQWFRADNSITRNQLILPGSYVVVKRFSSKEEKRRVVAYPLIIDKPIAIENHLNFIHQGQPRKVVSLQSKELCNGLAIWLNSTFIDNWFRDISGSTQVNAGDIKAMPCLPIAQLESLGYHWHTGMSQNEIDSVCGGLI